MSQKVATPPAPRRKGKKTARRHGYRGYGSGIGRDTGSFGGRVHWGRGFAGVGVSEGGSESLIESGLLTPELKEKISKKE